METVLTECRHGIPLVNGKGCVICSNRQPIAAVYVKMQRGERVTKAMRRLNSLKDNEVEVVDLTKFL